MLWGLVSYQNKVGLPGSAPAQLCLVSCQLQLCLLVYVCVCAHACAHAGRCLRMVPWPASCHLSGVNGGRKGRYGFLGTGLLV